MQGLQGGVAVPQQSEGNVVLGREARMTRRRVAADADDLAVGVVEQRELISECLVLSCAPWREVYM
jgi:hypothetical protein